MLQGVIARVSNGEVLVENGNKNVIKSTGQPITGLLTFQDGYQKGYPIGDASLLPESDSAWQSRIT